MMGGYATYSTSPTVYSIVNLQNGVVSLSGASLMNAAVAGSNVTLTLVGGQMQIAASGGSGGLNSVSSSTGLSGFTGAASTAAKFA